VRTAFDKASFAALAAALSLTAAPGWSCIPAGPSGSPGGGASESGQNNTGAAEGLRQGAEGAAGGENTDVEGPRRSPQGEQGNQNLSGPIGNLAAAQAADTAGRCRALQSQLDSLTRETTHDPQDDVKRTRVQVSNFMAMAFNAAKLDAEIAKAQQDRLDTIENARRARDAHIALHLPGPLPTVDESVGPYLNYLLKLRGQLLLGAGQDELQQQADKAIAEAQAKADQAAPAYAAKLQQIHDLQSQITDLQCDTLAYQPAANQQVPKGPATTVADAPQ